MEIARVTAPYRPIPPAATKASEQAMYGAGVVYSAADRDPISNYTRWKSAMAHAAGIRKAYADAGFHAAPWAWDALWTKVVLAVPGLPGEHLPLLDALGTDYGEKLQRQLRYRLQYGGNVHLEFAGSTGMAKSSCALALADWMSPILPGELVKCLSFDLSELPFKLRSLKAGQVAIQDEFPQQAGEGSRTVRAMFENLEDTLRGSQVSLFVNSPRQQEHATMQAQLQVIMWCPQRKESVFLVRIEGYPMGVVVLPWAEKALWDSYSVWKALNVERSKAGAFNDNRRLIRLAMDAFADQRLVEFLSTGNKPRRQQFVSAVRFFQPQMTTANEADAIVSVMYELCYNWERVEVHFKEWFGVTPNAGIKAVAEKCAA